MNAAATLSRARPVDASAPSLKALASALEADLRVLHAWSVSSEDEVLAVGAALGDIHQSIGRALEAMGQLGSTMTDATGAEAVDTLCGAAQGAARLDPLQRDAGAGLVELKAGVGHALKGTDEVRGLLLQLTHLAIIVRTNVRNHRRTEEHLGGFADEVTELIAGGRETAQGLLLCLRDMDRSLSRSRTETARDAAVDILALSVRLSELGQRLADYRRSAGDIVMRAAEQFRAVWAAIAKLVIGLQFHDMARQRLEHTIDGIERLVRVVTQERLEHDEAALTPARQEQALRVLARLEIAQLTALAKDCEGNRDEIQFSLGSIAASLAEAEALIATLYAGEASAAAGSVIAMLDAELAPIGVACRADERRRSELRAAMEACVTAAEPLAEVAASLSDFERDLRLSGLNAVIRAARIEGGSAVIGCISQELRTQAAAVRDEAAGVRKGVERALAAARSLTHEILPGVTAANTALQEGVERAAAILTELEARGRFQHEAATAAAGGLVDRLQRLADGALPALAAVEPMRATADRLADVVALVDSDDAEDPPWPELEAVLAARYTMASERLVHAAAAGTGDRGIAAPHGSGTNPPPPPADSDDLSDLLF